MSMYTRCPHCDSHFKVSREQLQASSGQVRCGRCEKPFDAFATLTSHLPVDFEPSKQSALRQASQAVGIVRDPPSTEFPSQRLSSKESDMPDGAFSTGGLVSASSGPNRAEDRGPLTLPDDLFSSGVAPKEDRRRRLFWAVGSLLLGVGLLAQTLYVFSGELALRLPEFRPVLAQTCGWLQCTLALPRMPDQLFIEASDLQVLDTTRPEEVLLTATIRNRAAFPQEWPLIELTLLDRLNQVSARKVLHPVDYLDKSQDPNRGIGANQDLPVKLYLNTGDLKPAGYRLYVFFA